MHAVMAKRLKQQDEREKGLTKKEKENFTFIVRDLVPQTLSVTTGPDMRTIKDLRSFIRRTFSVPEHLQRFTIRGRPFDNWLEDEALLRYAFEKKDNTLDEESKRIVHLKWLTDDDYLGIDQHQRSTLIRATDLERYQEQHREDARPCLAITLRQWKWLNAEAVMGWRIFRDEVDEDGRSTQGHDSDNDGDDNAN